MRIIKRKTIVEYYCNHPDAQTALELWFERTRRAEWNNFAQLRQTFNSADNVGNKRIVFNIKGNAYRLIAIVLFQRKEVYVRFVGTHKQYEQLSEEQIKNI